VAICFAFHARAIGQHTPGLLQGAILISCHTNCRFKSRAWSASFRTNFKGQIIKIQWTRIYSNVAGTSI